MSTPTQEDKDLNMPLVFQGVKELEKALDKATQKGVFTLAEAHVIVEYLAVVAKSVERCDLLQKKISHVMRQEKLLQQSSGAPMP
jgi:hypothetical protein